MECLGYSYLDNPVRKPRKPRTNRSTSTTAPSLGSTAMHLGSISSYPGTSTTHDSHEIVENQTGSDRWTAMPSHLSFYSHFDPLGDRPSLLGPPHSSQVDIPTAVPLQPSSDTAFSTHPQSTNDLPTQSHAQTPPVYPPAASDAMSSSEAYQMVSWGPNAIDDQRHMGSRTETRDKSDTEDEDEDAEGVMEAVRPMLGLDRDVPSNSLPYILSSHLRMMMRVLFEPMKKADLTRDFLARCCTRSDDTRYTFTLVSTAADMLDKNVELAPEDVSVMNRLENRLCSQLALVRTRLEVRPESYADDVFLAIWYMHGAPQPYYIPPCIPMAGERSGEVPRIISHHIQGSSEIKIQPETCEYPVSLKILAGDQAPHITSQVLPGQSLTWVGLPSWNIARSSQIEIRVYEHHKFGFTRKRAGTISYPVADIESTSSISKVCNAFGHSIGVICSIGSSGVTKPAVLAPQQSLEDRAKEALSVAESQKRQKRLMERIGPVRNIIDLLLKFGEVVAELDPRAKGAFSIITKAWDILGAQERCDESVETLVRGLVDILPSVGAIKHAVRLPQLQETVVAIWAHVVEASEFVAEYKSKGEAGHAWNVLTGSSPQEKVNAMIGQLRELKEQFDRGVSIQIFRAMEEQTKRVLLKDLDPMSLAQYDPDHACMSGTRKEILQDVSEWCKRPPTSSGSSTHENVLWIYGQAGLGKSSIANSIAEELDSVGWLAASFFCKRDDPDRCNARRILSTIIFGLAERHPVYADAVREVLEHGSLVYNAPVHTQFNKLVKNIIGSPGFSGCNDQLVVVIDALDECNPLDERKTLVELLLQTSELAPWIKIILTSRPYSDIQRIFENRGRHKYSTRDLYHYDASDDIYAYIEQRFSGSSSGYHFPEDAPNVISRPNAIRLLSDRAAGLFIWARTACEFILEDDDPQEVIKSIQERDKAINPMEALDTLYTITLEASLTRQGDNSRERATVAMRMCLSAIIVCSKRMPLSTIALSELFGGRIRLEVLESVVNRLKSVLYIDQSQGGTIRVYHVSFADYILDQIRSRGFSVAPQVREQNSYLADRCINVMMNELKFNICRLETSYHRNSQVKDLEERASQMIRPHLAYSCIYWASHIIEVQGRSSPDLMKKFLSGPFVLFWIETLSLVGKYDVGLSSLKRLMRNRQYFEQIGTSLLEDLICFMQTFSHPIRESAPHVYISGLAFLPSNVSKRTKYEMYFPNRIRIKSGALEEWSRWNQSMAHDGQVRSVAFSPNGRHIISGSYDKTVRIWDADTGAQVGELVGHLDWVESVDFSPDGRRIASGSSDKTVRVWNIDTGAPIGEPFTGHLDWVKSVAFSPNGLRIVSGSDDKTIRIWDANTGAQIGEPFIGHLFSVYSVAFAPDNRCVVSGSHDMTLRLWDVDEGSQIGEPLVGHLDQVTSVAFSPDGNRIVSGSGDNTVRVWDANTGTQIGEPLIGHMESVYSVAFSYDGCRVVSGSYDKTVRVWDANTGAQLGDALEGHSFSVSSVAFSPDGNRIVSGSDDRTIRVWDTDTGTQIGKPITSHSYLAHSAAHSPSGDQSNQSSEFKQLRLSNTFYHVPGSIDKANYVWDTETGARLGDLLAGYQHWNRNVKFSPDGHRIFSSSLPGEIEPAVEAEYAHLVSKYSALSASGGLPDTSSLPLSLAGLLIRRDWLATSPDGRRMAFDGPSGDNGSPMQVWDLDIGARIWENLDGSGSGSIQSAAFSPDGRRIVSGSSDGTVRVWNPDTSAQAVTVGVRLGEVFSVAFSPDGRRVVSGSSDKTVRVWDAQTGAQIGAPRIGHSQSVLSVVFSPNGRRIASGSRDETLRVWDVDTSVQIGEPLVGHRRPVISVAFSPDGLRIASGSEDGTVRVWASDSPFFTFDHLLTCAAPETHPSSTYPLPVTSRSASSNAYKESTPTASKHRSCVNIHQFMKHCASDGWVTAPSGHLLFWLPPEYRRHKREDSLLVIPDGSTLQPVWLDLSSFSFGADWTQVYAQAVEDTTA
ncbi:hypothetical protein RhiJN_21107 [Ceratobasidium sp. AG-Ba]|nr:hypothetical protein RhiJN_21107 [Ceratobasidium sp. AG-Ba]